MVPIALADTPDALGLGSSSTRGEVTEEQIIAMPASLVSPGRLAMLTVPAGAVRPTFMRGVRPRGESASVVWYAVFGGGDGPRAEER